jgi:putative peptide zinc metalloprotease protein
LDANVADNQVKVGSPAPELALESVQGPTVKLSDYRGRQNVVIWFSRGYNCPFCRRYMAQLDQAHDKFVAANTHVLEIGPNVLKPARIYFQRQPIKFPFLCDPSKAAYLRFGLRDQGPIEANINTIRSFGWAYLHGDGINTTRIAAGDTFTEGFVGRLYHHALTAMQQGVFIVDRDGIVRYANAFKPLDTIPPTEEILGEVAKIK